MSKSTSSTKTAKPVTKMVYVKVAIEVRDDVDIDDMMENVDYEFVYKGILDTEIREYLEEIDYYEHDIPVNL